MGRIDRIVLEKARRPPVATPASSDDQVTGWPTQPAVKLALHSTGAASRLAALLLAQIFPTFSVVAP
jgi:hypothetical protein